jgi:hypothetical protein
MVALLTSTLLLLVPLGAWALASTVIYAEYADRRARVDVRAMQPTMARVAHYFAATFLSVPFGFFLWYVVSGLESEFGTLSGPAERLVTSLAISFALTAVVTLAAQVSIARLRLSEMVAPGGSRVLPLIAVPSTGVVYILVLSSLLFGSVRSILNGSLSPPPQVVDSVVLSLFLFAATNFGYLGGALASNDISNLMDSRAFVRAILRLAIGEIPVVLGLLYAFFQLSSLNP